MLGSKSLFDKLEMRNRVEEIEARKLLERELASFAVDMIPHRANDHISRVSWMIENMAVSCS